MTPLTKNLPIDYPNIENAFRSFYDYMRDFPHFKQLFESEKQIDQLIHRQAQNFYQSLQMNKEDFSQNYERLGYMYAELSLPIEDMFAGLGMIRDSILKSIPSEHHQHIYQIIEKMEKWLAKGYLTYQMTETKKLVEISIKNIRKVTPEKHQSYVLRPVNWLSNLLKNYEDPDFFVVDAIDCPLTSIINSLDLDEEVRKQMQYAHREQHALGASFLFFYRDKNYKLVGFILSKLISISLALSNQMSYVVTQSIIQQLKHDNLTGLLLRHSLKEQYELVKNHALSQNEGFGILIMDIDFFKKINDSYGHQAGDKALKIAGKLLSQHARSHDITFRYGGEEFLMLATNLSPNHLPNIAERIRQAFENLKIVWEDTPIPITISIGCHWVNPSELERPLEQLIEQADKNLYQAKESGRNQVICTGIEPSKN